MFAKSTPLASLITACSIVMIAGPAFGASSEFATPQPTVIVDSKVVGQPAQPLLSQAELWVQKRSDPDQLELAKTEKKKKRPVRKFVKALGKELGTMTDSMGKDLVLAFSVQDIDPYDQEKAPTDRPAIVLEFSLVDGTTAYLRRFLDGSFAIEGGFEDGTVIVPTKQAQDFIIKYPNGAKGRIVRDGSTITVYRPDDTVTKLTKNDSGGYDINNTKLGYMGSARPDPTGIQYELGTW